MRYIFSILVLLLIAAAPAVAQQCPSVTIDGPTQVEPAVAEVKLKAKLANAPANVEVLYRWTVSAGTITSGIGTSEIQLDIAGLGGQAIEITLETLLGDDSCKSNTKHSVEIELPLPACGMPLDEYGDIRWGEEKARLDNFAIQLQKSPTSRGLLTAFAGKRTYRDEARLRLLRARNYLVRVRAVDPKRLITVDGGYRGEFTVIVTMVPEGVTMPDYSYGEQIPKDQIKFTKRRPRNIRPW